MPGPVLVSSERKVDIDVLERARALIPVLAARSPATVESRRVPDETIQDNDHPLQVILRDALAGATHRAFSWEAHARAYSQSIGIERRGAPPIGP